MVLSKFDRNVFLFVILCIALLTLSYNLDYFHPETRVSLPVTVSKPVSRPVSRPLFNKSTDLKYLLVWFNESEPIKSNFLEGQFMFKRRKCSYNKCYVTAKRQLLGDVADFDVILFHGRDLTDDAKTLPQSRSPRQKYVYASMESSANYPVCNPMYNNYFNWTWAYKLNSDENYGYMSIRDKEGNVIGPKEEMHWKKLEDMMPINDTLKAKLSTKKIAAAWFVSHCGAGSGRDLIAKQLQTELAKYDMQVDIYGKCGTKNCPRGAMKECLHKVETDYYFYLSFENSFAEDYVTEKLLIALNHYAVPVVYGGANYTRFMPDGIYLTAERSRISELAKEMVNIIKNKQIYYDFFKWHNHYSYYDVRESRDTDAYCKLCALISNEEQFLRTSVYKDFIQWWSPAHKCH